MQVITQRLGTVSGAPRSPSPLIRPYLLFPCLREAWSPAMATAPPPPALDGRRAGSLADDSRSLRVEQPFQRAGWGGS